MKEHILELDKPRKLKYGFKALGLIRAKYGKDTELTDVMDIETDELPFFAWAGLAWEDGNLTVEQVEDLIEDKIGDTYTIMDIVGIIVQAIADHVGVKLAKKKVKNTTVSKRPAKSRSK
jgi:hypothetical protein